MNRKGNNNPAWKEEGASYGAIHYWIRTRKPKPLFCESCKEVRNTEVALKGKKYTRNINDYWYICRSCHMKGDGRTEKAVAYGKSIKRKNINCANCGKEFHPKKQSSRFCNLPCYRKWNVGENHWHNKRR